MDYGVFSALSGKKDWGQIRADRQNEIVMQRQMQADLQARIDKEAQARAGVVEYMNSLNNASVLEQDLERVKSVEAEQRKKIVEGLKKAGNNYNKYLLGAGAGELNNYYQNVMKSEEMQSAINNKLVYAQSSLDTYLGRKSRPTEITLPDGTVREASMQEQMDLFNRGEITKLNYAGSVQPTDLAKIQQAIQQTYSQDPYRRKQANKEDIYEYAMRFGAEDWEAKQLADSYEAGMVSGAETPIYFNYKEREQIPAASVSGDMAKWFSQISSTNLWKDYLDGNLATETPVKKKWGDKEVTFSRTPVNGDTMQKIISATNMKYDAEKQSYTYNGDATLVNNGKKIKIPSFEIRQDGVFDYVTYTDPNTGGQVGGLRVKVEIPSEKGGQKKLGMSWWDKIIAQEGDMVSREKDLGGIFGANDFKTQVIIPLDQNNQYIRNAYIEPKRTDDVYTDEVMQQLIPMFIQGQQALNEGQ